MKLMIKEARRAARLTQTDLANAIGVNLSTVGNWERGITIPDIEQVFNCAVALGCTPNDLCGWDSDGVAPSFSDGGQAALNGYYESMNDQGREALVQTARLMSGSPDTRIQKDRPEHVRVQEAV